MNPYGWCWSCGLEEQDIILEINDRPARVPADLRQAIQDSSKPYVVLMTTTPTGGQFRFCLPLPLGEPELHCMGFLFDQDPKLGFHIVVGLLKNSAAEKAGLIRGCCIRKIDGSALLSPCCSVFCSSSAVAPAPRRRTQPRSAFRAT